MEDIPIIYAYIYRNIKNISYRCRIIDSEVVIKSLRKIIYKAPATVYRDIFTDMEKMGLLKRLDRRKYLLLSNQACDKKIKRLKEYVFPITPL